MQRDEITAGDLLRRRDGATVRVESIIDWYEDRDGRHEGPFVTEAKTFHHYPLTDFTETVEKNERVCVFCGSGVTSTNPEIDYCRGCHYGGNGLERILASEERGNLLGRIEDIDAVASTAIWHTGGGCFLLAVKLADGRLLTPSLGYEDVPTGDLENGPNATDSSSIWPEPGIPEGDERWCVVVSKTETDWQEWVEENIELDQRLYTDDELVARIAEVASA